MKTSSLVNASRTGLPFTARVNAAVKGSIITSCLFPNPPPIYGLITLILPHGNPSACPTILLAICGICVEETITIRSSVST